MEGRKFNIVMRSGGSNPSTESYLAPLAQLIEHITLNYVSGGLSPLRCYFFGVFQ